MSTKLDVIDVNEKAGQRQEQEQIARRRRQRERMRAKKLARKRRRRKQLLFLGMSVIVIVLLVGVLKNVGKKVTLSEAGDGKTETSEQGSEGTEAMHIMAYEILYPEFYRNHKPEKLEDSEVYTVLKELALEYPEFEGVYEERENYPVKLLAALCNNPEMLEYVEGYAKYHSGDKTVAGEAILTAEEMEQQYPLFLQWDKRWGYEEYGDFNIALSGCGPTCLSMVLVAQNRDYTMTPDKVASFAMKNGFYVEGTGTAWSLMTDGAREMGLSSEEIALDEYVMKNQLDAGRMIICSVGPGDFTTLGHFIVIYDYDKNGFRVNDPNSVYRSSRSWAYGELASQIRILWSFGKK